MKSGDDALYWDKDAMRYVNVRIASVYDGIAVLLWNDDELHGHKAQVPLDELTAAKEGK